METFVLIPKETLENILNNQEKIIKKLDQLSSEKKNLVHFFKYISESEAQTILMKKQTWFWKQRTEGKLAYTKVGNTVYYKKEDINKLFDDNFQGVF